MDNHEIFQSVFIALLVSVFLSMIGFMENLISYGYGPLITSFIFKWFLIAFCMVILSIKPSLLNIEDKEIISFIRKISALAMIGWFIFFLIVSCSYTCSHGGFNGLEYCANLSEKLKNNFSNP